MLDNVISLSQECYFQHALSTNKYSELCIELKLQ